MQSPSRHLRRAAATAGVAGLALAAVTATAHHPIYGKFDQTRMQTLEGVVTKVDWRNPHAHIFMNVVDDGETANWAVEIESPAELHLSGWRRESLAPGDAIVVEGPVARDGSRQIWGASVARKGSGQALFVLDPDLPRLPLQPRPAPRWPDGHVALGASPDSADGYWGYPTETALVEDGVEVRMSPDGQLANIADAARVAPFQPWALALYRHRQERFLQDDPMFQGCKPPGGPRIFLDGREPVGQVGGDDDNPLFYGRSVGAWEGDTLVARTTGFNDEFWFSNGGLPHTDLLTLTEKFTRVDFDTLRYEVTIDDPGAYTRPWTASWDLLWVGGATLPVHLCQENRP
jgi:hypothetical protein